jgi:hypothetical protein
MKDGSQGYDVPFSICEHGSLKRSCSVCIYQAELHEAREQLNILKAALEEIATYKRDVDEPHRYAYDNLKRMAVEALSQINGKGETT